MLTTFSKNTLVPLLLRLALAAIFIYHGLELVWGPDNQWGTSWMNKMKMDYPAPAPVQALVAWGELLGGVAMALGLLTRLAALGIVIIMTGAIATVHWPYGFVDVERRGYEYNFAIIVMCLCLMLGGAGPLSLDSFVRFFRPKKA
jgi:putative oxidoreductase